MNLVLWELINEGVRWTELAEHYVQLQTFMLVVFNRQVLFP
jgi:hypothetical protein